MFCGHVNINTPYPGTYVPPSPGTRGVYPYGYNAGIINQYPTAASTGRIS